MDALFDVLEAALYASPRDPFLRVDQVRALLVDVGDHELHYEVEQAASRDLITRRERSTIRIHPNMVQTRVLGRPWRSLVDKRALNFVADEVIRTWKSVGEAPIPWDVLVARAEAGGIDGAEAEKAMRLLTDLSPPFELSETGIFARHKPPDHRFGDSWGALDRSHPEARRLEALVVQVIEAKRRDMEGRPTNPDPRRAFAEKLQKLGHSELRVWWYQMLVELGTANHATHPTTVLVLAAGLAEGALVAVALHAFQTGDSFRRDFARGGDPPGLGIHRAWSLDALLDAAASGQDAIVDGSLKAEVVQLNRHRQRIHAARFLEAHPDRLSADLRPEEATRGLHTLDRLLRAVLNWIDRHPVPDA